MKVISQLIRHFWERGALSTAEAEYLVQQGFCRSRDLAGFRSKRLADSESLDDVLREKDAAVQPPRPLDMVEETLVRRSSSRRGGGPGVKGEVIEIDELCSRLRKEFDRREEFWPSLVRLGRRAGKLRDWTEAAIALRQLNAAEFHTCLANCLRQRTVLLDELWQAVDPEPLHHLVVDSDVRGRAVRAYLALLTVDDPGRLGKYAWVLKHDEMQAVSNLRQVHRGLLRGLCELFHRQRRLLSSGLSRGVHPVTFWSLVLLYNALRPPHLAPDADPAHEYGPLDEPATETWQQAWTCALMMDPVSIGNLLIRCYGKEVKRRRVQTEQSQVPLICPNEWRMP